MRARDFRRSGEDYKVTCPSCGGEYKMYVNFKKGIYHCFRCHSKGRVSKDLRDAIVATPAPAEKKAEPLPEHLNSITANPVARRYLQDRGIKPMNDWGFCSFGRYYDRIIIPLKCFGKYWGFQARTVDEYEPRRYLSSKGLPIHQLLWGFDETARQTNHSVIITEGVFAARWVNQNRLGISAIAAFTKRLSPKQASTIATRFKTCFIAFDSDAVSEALEASWLLYRYGVDTHVIQMKRKGPDDHTVDEFTSLNVYPLFEAVRSLGGIKCLKTVVEPLPAQRNRSVTT